MFIKGVEGQSVAVCTTAGPSLGQGSWGARGQSGGATKLGAMRKSAGCRGAEGYLRQIDPRHRNAEERGARSCSADSFSCRGSVKELAGGSGGRGEESSQVDPTRFQAPPLTLRRTSASAPKGTGVCGRL